MENGSFHVSLVHVLLVTESPHLVVLGQFMVNLVAPESFSVINYVVILN